jgi:hypothetical protein
MSHTPNGASAPVRSRRRYNVLPPPIDPKRRIRILRAVNLVARTKCPVAVALRATGLDRDHNAREDVVGLLDLRGIPRIKKGVRRVRFPQTPSRVFEAFVPREETHGANVPKGSSSAHNLGDNVTRVSRAPGEETLQDNGLTGSLAHTPEANVLRGLRAPHRNAKLTSPLLDTLAAELIACADPLAPEMSRRRDNSEADAPGDVNFSRHHENCEADPPGEVTSSTIKEADARRSPTRCSVLKQRVAAHKPTVVMRCAECSTRFEARSLMAKFCGVKCRVAHWRM